MNLAIKTCYLCTGRCGRTEFQLPFDKWEALLLQAHVIRQILTGPLSSRSGVRTAKLDSAGLDWASSLVVVIQSFFYSHISNLADMCSRWRMLLTSSGTPTQIIRVISNDMIYRTAEYWQETGGDLFVRSGSLVLLHLSFFSRVCGRYSTELSLKHHWWMYTSQSHRWRWYLEPAAPSWDYRA